MSDDGIEVWVQAAERLLGQMEGRQNELGDGAEVVDLSPPPEIDPARLDAIPEGEVARGRAGAEFGHRSQYSAGGRARGAGAAGAPA